MSSTGHMFKNVVKNATAQAVSASATNQVVSDVFRLSHADSLWFRARVKFSSQTVAVGVTAKLQTNSHIDGVWLDSKTLALTGASGTFEFKLLKEDTNDQTYLPLLSLARIVITTGAGDATTIDSIFVSNRP